MRSMRSTPPPREVSRIVEDQVKRWALQRREEKAATANELPWPVITVSREHGSLGSMAAARAAELLGFGFWDQELVQRIAEESGLQHTLVTSLDEKTRTKIEDFISSLLVGADSSIAEYVRHVTRVVRTFERHGSAVVVGRGAQYILDPATCFRVRVVCPEPIRVQRIAALHRLTEKEALRRIRTVERERVTFLRQHYDRDVADSSDYDLVVNTGHLSVAAAAEIMVAGYGSKYPAPRPATVEIPENAADSAPRHPQPAPV